VGERDSRSRIESSLGAIAPIPRVSPLRARRSSAKLSAPAPSRIQESPFKPVGSSSNRLGAEDQFQSADNLESREHAPNFSDAIHAVPSWLISMVVHIAILLVLAICTLSIDEIAHDQIVVEISDSPVEMISAMMEVSLEESELDDLAQSLEFPEQEPIEFEDVMLAPEFEDSSELSDFHELPPIDLPEFRTAEEKKKAMLDSESQTGLDDAMKGSGPKDPSESNEPKYTEFFGTKAYGSRFVFVIDGSSSMMNSRWLRATRELLSTLNELDEDQEFLVLVYNTSTMVMFNLPTDQADLIPATDENTFRTKVWLGNQRPRGGTLPARTMQLALRMKPDAIYFLSDGELADDTMFRLKTWNSPKKDAKGVLRKIPIHTVLLGSRFGLLTMKTIADQNNGIFTSVR